MAAKLVIKNTQILFPVLFKPEIPKFKSAEKDAKPVFSLTCAFSAEQAEALRAEVAGMIFPAGAIPPKMPKSLGINDGDMLDPETGDRKFGKYLEGFHFLRASSQFAPSPLWIGASHRTPTEDEVYSGMIGNVAVVPKAYDYNGRKGVSYYLAGLLITRRGTKLSLGGGDASEDLSGSSADFDDFGDDSATSDLL